MTKYFEDIAVGSEYVTNGRTIIDSDIINFAGLTGDFNLLHTDLEWIQKNSPFERRIAHGLLITSIGEGLICMDMYDWYIMAFLEFTRAMKHPVFPGDTVRQVFRVTDKRLSKSKPDRGIVTLDVEILNQDDVACQTGQNKFLIGARS